MTMREKINYYRKCFKRTGFFWKYAKGLQDIRGELR